MTAARPDNGHFGMPSVADGSGAEGAGGRGCGHAPAAAISLQAVVSLLRSFITSTATSPKMPVSPPISSQAMPLRPRALAAMAVITAKAIQMAINMEGSLSNCGAEFLHRFKVVCRCQCAEFSAGQATGPVMHADRGQAFLQKAPENLPVHLGRAAYALLRVPFSTGVVRA